MAETLYCPTWCGQINEQEHHSSEVHVSRLNWVETANGSIYVEAQELIDAVLWERSSIVVTDVDDNEALRMKPAVARSLAAALVRLADLVEQQHPLTRAG